MHLLDAEVVWALRGAKAGLADAAVAGWAAAQGRTALFVSALALAELGAVASAMERTDKAGAAAVRRWIDGQIPAAFEGRILPVDAAVARRAAALAYPDLRDGLIAATALEHGLVLATRHPAAFRTGKVRTVNPWGYTPDQAEEDLDWREAARGGPVWLKNLFVRG